MAEDVSELTFDEAVERRQAAVGIRDAAQHEIDNLTPHLAGQLVVAGEKARKACNNQWNVTLVDSKRDTLSKEKLLELGVSMEQIKQATVTSTSTSIRVTRVTK